jgi:hypothetical protein
MKPSLLVYRYLTLARIRKKGNSPLWSRQMWDQLTPDARHLQGAERMIPFSRGLKWRILINILNKLPVPVWGREDELLSKKGLS